MDIKGVNNVKKTQHAYECIYFGGWCWSNNPCVTSFGSLPSAKCQVPCGIYDDHARVKRMLEDAATIEKAIVKLSELADKQDVQSTQQVVRRRVC